MEETSENSNNEMTAGSCRYQQLPKGKNAEITHAAIIKAPETRIGLRPALSTQMTAGIVARNMLSLFSVCAYAILGGHLHNTNDTRC
jgi:hypothetical protein